MKSFGKYFILLFFTSLLLFFIVLFKRHVNEDYQLGQHRLLIKLPVKEDGEVFEKGIVQGVAAIQIEQAMAERKIPPLKPFILPPDATVSNEAKRILIVASWRTGSSFLGDVIHSAPGVFYSYEPLVFKGYTGSKMSFIREIFQCNFRYDYLQQINGWLPENVEFMSRNRRVWEACGKDRSLCLSPKFVHRLCVHFPIQLMKVVRLRVSELIQDNLPNDYKVIYLARDPRGVMASRADLGWCQKDPECSDVNRLCDNVLSDLKLIKKLAESEPDRYYVLRFEDLSANVEQETKKLFGFLNMTISMPVQVFLNTHTRAGRNQNQTEAVQNDPFSTRRQSNTVADQWRKKLSKQKIESISRACEKVLNLMNYQL